MPAAVESQALERLLDLQAEDTATRRLMERKESLPEAARLREVNDQLAELRADLEIATKQNDELQREQNRIEGEIGLLDERIAREEQRLFSGNVSNPKELSNLQAEVDMLKRKRGELEDGLLEVMVQKDEATATFDRLTEESDKLSLLSDELNEAVMKLTGEIDAELDSHQARRAELQGEVPDDILTLYDKLRDSKGGIGAAELEGDTCSGCHTKLPAREVERLRADRGLQRCDNCRRILVVR